MLVALRLATAEPVEDASVPEPAGDGAELAEPRWLRYRVSAGEHLVDVAGRFGVEVEELIAWNELEAGAHRVRTGKRLKVRARRDPPPRVRTTYVARRGDTWQSVAIAQGIDSRKLRAYNWKLERLRPGSELVIWNDPGQPRTLGRTDLEPVLAPAIPDQATSSGRPQVGRIRKSVRLPESPLYVRARPNWSWGSSHTLQQLVDAIARFRAQAGYAGSIVIGSISRKGGGAFPPHNSHQSGRDVDVRLPVRPGVSTEGSVRADEVDWEATWGLIEALVDTGQVQVIFLERKMQRRLYEAARRSGESHDRLATVIRYADDGRWSHAIVRHADGHDGHIHVRFRCGPAERRCKG